MKRLAGDLSVTALYTAGVWGWGRMPDAELLDHSDARRVFRMVNAVLSLARPFIGGGAPLKVALLHRHVAIDELLRASGLTLVIELAAGLSRRGITFTADPNIDYIEVDRPAVIAKKRALLERTRAGRLALVRPRLRFVAADISEVVLASLSSGDGRPAFIIAEGLMMYLEAEAQRALARRIVARLRDDGGTFVFDYVPPAELPRAGLIGSALGWLMKRFTGGQGFAADARSRKQVAEDLRECGFDEVQWVEAKKIANRNGCPFPHVASEQLIFIARVTPSDGRGRLDDGLDQL
jgi:O-methyltransferase involved in polyketide biosynthesis